MPTFSDRATLLRDIERLLKLMILYNDDDGTEDEDEFENMVLFYEYISSRRYVNERVQIPKSLEFCNAIFNYPDDVFRTIIDYCPKSKIIKYSAIVLNTSKQHVKGMLKSRFGSLKGIRVQVSKLEYFARVNKWIKVCIILYNILFHCDRLTQLEFLFLELEFAILELSKVTIVTARSITLLI